MPNKDDAEQPRIYVTSYNQQGGITAGIVNIQGVVPARAEFSPAQREQRSDDYLTRVEMTLMSQYTIPNLQISVVSPTLRDIDVYPTSGGMQMDIQKTPGTVRSGPLVGQRAIQWQERNVGGKYVIEAVTEREELVTLEVRQL